MRVTGGQFRGLSLQAPKGPEIRPTLDHVRQAIFNLIGPKVERSRVLDLFSGSGALGIEALSRGAARVTFVDRSYFSIQAIEANLASLAGAGLDPSRFEVHRSEVLTALRQMRREGELFDIVLLDPPYGRGFARKTLNGLTQYVIVAESGWVVAEHDKRDSLPPKLTGKSAELVLQRQARYGDTALTLYRRGQTP
ncbi:MAG: 16S rRNA (guanine(966)-N(2))-methyltransferase RsmD [Candidatus Omnitrophica bacterium]|nr:16S rRNA (guanine(966)-N(2))-methyltransferase RsmD [Candidatus Omnitrophota bacterium]